MKESILLSELQNYLAYGLKVKNITGEKYIVIGTYIDTNSLICSSEKYSKIELSISNLKPLVRPLSELTEEDVFNLGFFDTSSVITTVELFIINIENKYVTVGEFEWLVKNHFDCFNWLERGLAISLTDFEKEKV